MRTRLRSVVDAILGRVPGKTGRPDTATRMAMDADLDYRRELSRPRTEGDDQHLGKSSDPFRAAFFIWSAASIRPARRSSPAHLTKPRIFIADGRGASNACSDTPGRPIAALPLAITAAKYRWLTFAPKVPPNRRSA